MGPPTVDSGAALALATAAGVPMDVAAELIGAAAMGVMEGAVDQQRREKDGAG